MRRPRAPKAAIPADPFATALDHAWAWFSMHADQRIRTMNIYFVLFALVSAGYGTFFGIKAYLVSASIAAVGAVASFAFFLLEERNRILVRIAEAPLQDLQAALAEAAALPSLRMLELAGMVTGWKRMAKYSWVFRATTISGLILMLAGSFFAVLVYLGQVADTR